MQSFNEMNLNKKVLESINNIHFKKPTKIQELFIPTALKGGNLACKGKTGSGKTHCFLIPIANGINEDENTNQALIITPTRELALQTYKNTKEFFSNYNIKIAMLVGGIDINKEIEVLKQKPQIIIATPSKLQELGINNALINFFKVNYLVIDEADMSLEMGFLNEIDRVASLATNAQILVFSATIPVGIKQFIHKYFKDSRLIEDDKSTNNENIVHTLYPLRNRNKFEILLNIINHINPYVCLIFANTKDEVEKVYNYLNKNEIDCAIIHGSLQARERKSTIKNALDGRYKYIVCSDIAARGIDIEGVSYIISLGFPTNNLEFYIHRAGRTGRINQTGECITLYNDSDAKSIRELEKQGITFVTKEIKNNEFVELKEFDSRAKRKAKTNEELESKIQKAIRINKSKKVKPNYKKKVNEAIKKVKQQHKREIIRQDIKKQIKERAIKKSKGNY